jgi:initiation factor 1A
MVKNTAGGCRAKGQARKYAVPQSTRETKALRVALDECEIYAQVSKMLGNGMCHVTCIDGEARLCLIRGKFRGGRGKKDNFVGIGSWVLVGLREWESTKEGGKQMQKCDLLEVYSDHEKQRLKNTTNVNWKLFNDTDRPTGTSDDSLNIDFTNETTYEDYDNLMNSSTVTTREGQTVVQSVRVDGEEVNVDDI